MQTHEDLQGPPAEGHGQGHHRGHRQHRIWEKEEQVKKLPADLQPPSQSSQGDLQVSPHHSQCTKKIAATIPQV